MCVTGVAHVKVYDLTCYRCGTYQGIQFNMCVTGDIHVKVYDFTCVLQVWHMSRCMILHVCYRCGTCQGI